MLNFAPHHRNYGHLCSTPLFGDKRIRDRHIELLTRMSSTPKVIVHQLSESYAQEAAYYRLLGNNRYSFEDILRSCGLETLSSAKDRHVLAIGDTTEINLQTRAAHYSDGEQCGYLSNNRSRGLISHVSIALDADNLWVLGLCDLLSWGRPKAKKKKSTTLRDRLPLEKKESYKWSLGVSGCEEVLASAKQITYVFDREADILSLFQQIEEGGSDFVIRIKHNRKLKSGLTISEALTKAGIKGTHKLKIRGEKARKSSRGHRIKARKKREAELKVSYTQIELSQSTKSYYVLDILEKPDSVPEQEKAIHWRILTTHPIHSLSDALKILSYYSARWMIEELFRIIKSKGFQLETVQLRKVSSIRKIICLTMAAGLKILQLSLAKSQQEQIPIELVFNQQEITVIKILSTKLEGKTDKQKNPYNENEVIYAHWVFARLGGWKGYQTKRPPGPITLLRGKSKFAQFFEAYMLFSAKDVWEP